MMLEWFDKHLAGQPITNITREVAIELRDLRATEQSKSTANRYMALLRAMLNQAAGDWQMLDAAPKVKMFSLDKAEPRWITKEQLAKLAQELPPHQRAMAEFGVNTGLRQSNVKGLTWDRVDMKRAHVWIPAKGAKANKPITVPLNKKAVQVLTAQQGNHETFVFAFEGNPITQVNTKAWRNAVKRAGLQPFRWHDLRHTWASWHVQGGTPLHILKELGAWASLDMVQVYAHLATEHLADYVGFDGGRKPAHQKSRKSAKSRKAK